MKVSRIGILVGVFVLPACEDTSEPPPPVIDIGTDRVAFPDVGVSVIKPADFAKSETFHGFQFVPGRTSVMVVRVPGPFAQVSAGFDAPTLARRGMRLDRKEPVDIGSEKGWLLAVTQSAGGVEFGKWIVAFGDDESSLMVTATFPLQDTDDKVWPTALRKVVLSAQRAPYEPAEPGRDLPFRIEISAKMKGARGVGKMLACTADGAIPVKSPGQPLFIAAPSLSKMQVDDRKTFAEQRLHQTANTKDRTITSTEPITVDGLEGFESLADAKDQGSETPIKLYQAILFDGETYILMQGLVGADTAAEYLPEFKAMARSLVMKKK